MRLIIREKKNVRRNSSDPNMFPIILYSIVGVSSY